MALDQQKRKERLTMTKRLITDANEAGRLLKIADFILKAVPADGRGTFEYRFNRRLYNVTATIETKTRYLEEQAQAGGCVINFSNSWYEHDGSSDDSDSSKRAIIVIRFTLEQTETLFWFQAMTRRDRVKLGKPFAAEHLNAARKHARETYPGVLLSVVEAKRPTAEELKTMQEVGKPLDPRGVHRAKYSVAEQDMADSILKRIYPDPKDTEFIYRLSPTQFYSILCGEVFMARLIGPDVDSLRRCIVALQDDKVRRLTPEFDALIRLDDACIFCNAGRVNHSVTDHEFTSGGDTYHLSSPPSKDTFLNAVAALAQEYVEEAENADGPEYWTIKLARGGRMTAVKAVEDFGTYIKELLRQPVAPVTTESTAGSPSGEEFAALVEQTAETLSLVGGPNSGLWQVVIEAIGPNTVYALHALRDTHPGWGLQEAKDYIYGKSYGSGQPYMQGLSKAYADTIAAKLSDVGVVCKVFVMPDKQVNL